MDEREADGTDERRPAEEEARQQAAEPSQGDESGAETAAAGDQPEPEPVAGEKSDGDASADVEAAGDDVETVADDDGATQEDEPAADDSEDESEDTDDEPEAEDTEVASAERTAATDDTDTDDVETDDTEPDDSDDDDTSPADETVDDDSADTAGDEADGDLAAGGAERAGRGPRRGAHARRVTPRERLRGVIAPQANRTQALIALACLIVGFGLSVQVRSTSQESSFSSLRQSELVGLLDRLNKRQDGLHKEVSRLDQEKAALKGKDSAAARRAAQDRQHTLAILAGTEPATGPGIELVITDPHDGVSASDMLNAVQELRDAGAEVLQIGSVRVAVDTYFRDSADGMVVDGKKLEAPYRIKAIGDPHTMRTAMDIPGGVLETLHRAGADGAVSERQSVAVTAVRKS